MELEDYSSHFNPSKCLGRIQRIVDKPVVSATEITYAALETRYAIESTLSYYHDHISNGVLSKRKQKLYKPKDIYEGILNKEPEFVKLMTFAKYFIQSIEKDRNLVMPDIDMLQSSYSFLGNVLHAPLKTHSESMNDNFWIKILEQINIAKVHIAEVLEGAFPQFQLNKSGTEIFEKFLLDKISENELIQELKEKP